MHESMGSALTSLRAPSGRGELAVGGPGPEDAVSGTLLCSCSATVTVSRSATALRLATRVVRGDGWSTCRAGAPRDDGLDGTFPPWDGTFPPWTSRKLGLFLRWLSIAHTVFYPIACWCCLWLGCNIFVGTRTLTSTHSHPYVPDVECTSRS